MTGIRVATLLHILWGVYLVFFWWRVPQPFGAFEPFYLLVKPFQLGMIFLFIASIAAAKNITPDHPWWLRPALVVPQQIVLVWGLVGGFVLVYHDENADRNLLALCYIFSITVFHTLDTIELWVTQLIKREVRKNGASGLP